MSGRRDRAIRIEVMMLVVLSALLTVLMALDAGIL